MKRILLTLLLTAACAAPLTAKNTPYEVTLPALIPAPQQVEVTGPYLVPLLKVKSTIDTTLDLPAEGYILETFRRGVRITANDRQG